MEALKTKIDNADLYVGKNAISRIERYIENATNSIKVISPYIAKYQIENLIKKRFQGLDVKLISSQGFLEAFHLNDILKKLIIQNVYTFEDKKKRRATFKIFLIGLYWLFLALCLIPLFLKSPATFYKSYFWIYIAFAFILIFLQSKYSNMVIYNYEYNTIFPVKLISNPFVHVKIFIIDNKVAFVGSMNFTYKTRDNIESCITIYDNNCIQELNTYFDELMNTDLFEIDIIKRGKFLFREPKN